MLRKVYEKFAKSIADKHFCDARERDRRERKQIFSRKLCAIAKMVIKN